MIELLKDILVDLVLFSLIEGYIFTKFFQVIGGCKKFKWWEILLLGLVNCIVSQTLRPLIYQLVGLIFIGIMIFIKNRFKIIKVIIIVILTCSLTIIFEAIYAMLLEFIFGVDMSLLNNKLTLFSYLIPLKILEIIIFWMTDLMKTEPKFWYGDNIKRK